MSKTGKDSTTPNSLPLGRTVCKVERITEGTTLLAIIIWDRFRENGVHFFTDAQLSQQLAYMRHPTGKIIAPHVHNPVLREVQNTQEVLFIKRGSLRADFYDGARRYLTSRILQAGDTIMLVSGGHGFEVLDEIEMIEVKQGPYAGDKDKSIFEPSET